MQIKLATGDTYYVLGVHGMPVTYQGVTRDQLTFLFEPEMSVDALLDIFTPEACKVVTIIGDDGSENVHENYTIRTDAGKGYKGVAINGPLNEEQQVAWVSMAQSTLQERQLLEQKIMIDRLLAHLDG